MSTDLLDLLAVIRTELLDPQWGQHRSDVIHPVETQTPRIIAEKIGRALQSIVYGEIPVLQKSLALEDEAMMHYRVIHNHAVGKLIDKFKQVCLSPKRKNINSQSVR